ncbi:MAG: Eco47II family restriction endonuclease [Ruminococcus sp.]|nr:Eco47II family restriction endonuclease [Ruminococcus sp.]
MHRLTFISEADFKNHVSQTLKSYDNSLKSIDLMTFNSNIIDPIKLLFDKSAFRRSFDDVVNLEIHRQRDKSNTNAIGYFHQNIFRYIKNCVVPPEGWDVIVTLPEYKIYVEMKNTHNTMNSSSSQKIYIQMQNQILQTPNDYCFLVEAIAPVSRNIPWSCSVNKQHCSNEHIRRVSMDKFYALVTGIKDAFFQMCLQLPETIDELIEDNMVGQIQEDTVLAELHQKNPDTLKAMYLLAFESYEGFNQLIL